MAVKTTKQKLIEMIKGALTFLGFEIFFLALFAFFTGAVQSRKGPIIAPDGSAVISTDIEDFDSIFTSYIENLYPGCSSGEVQIYKNVYLRTTFIKKKDLQTLEQRSSFIHSYCRDKMKDAVPDGADVNDVIDAATCITISDLSYDKEACIENGDTVSQEQGCYYSLTEGQGKAVCASYAKYWKCLIDVVPFDEEGKVDWEEENPEHPATVLIVSNHKTGHEWNAVSVNGGDLVYYDVTNMDAGSVIDKYYSDMTIQDVSERKLYMGSDEKESKIVYSGSGVNEIVHLQNFAYKEPEKGTKE